MGSLAAALVGLGFSCASDPPPRPAQLDPSNPAAPESRPIGANAPEAPHPVASGGAQDPHEQTAEPAASVDAGVAPSDAHAGHHASGAENSPRGGSTDDAKKGGVTGGYTCPMHPEVFSPTPGRCPKCGMTLVPKRNQEPHGHDHRDGGEATP